MFEGNILVSLVGYMNKVCLRFVLPDSSLKPVQYLDSFNFFRPCFVGVPPRIQEYMRN